MHLDRLIHLISAACLTLGLVVAGPTLAADAPKAPAAKEAPKAEPAKEAPKADAKPDAKVEEASCAVSGEKFVPKANSPKSEYKGKTYWFCCPGCKKKFDANPEKFAQAGAKDDKPCADCGDKGKDGKPCNGDCEDKGAKGGKDDKPCHGDAKCACGHKDCKGDCKDCKDCKGKDAKDAKGKDTKAGKK